MRKYILSKKEKETAYVDGFESAEKVMMEELLKESNFHEDYFENYKKAYWKKILL